MEAKIKKTGFTLVELLVVISIIALLLSILVPALVKARAQGRSVVCSSNLKQIGLGFGMYLEDHDRKVFPLVYNGKNDKGQLGRLWYYGFEPGRSFSRPEGSRELFRESAKLFPYIKGYDSVEICPSFPYSHGRYKPKYTTRWMTYGINDKLSRDMRGFGQKIVNFDSAIKSPNSALLFADSAQVNTFQSPASPANPMFEEWHYVQRLGSPNVHFRHNGKANILFGDGHVWHDKPQSDSFDRKLPDLKIGRFGENVRFE